MVAKLSSFKDRMCACKDQACVDAVTNDMAAWSTEQAKASADMSDYTAESGKQMQAVMDGYSKCMTAFYGGTATTTTTTTAPAAAAPARKKTASASSAGASSSSSSGPKACVPSHWTRCGNNCYDLQNDRYNCGACGHSCPHGKDLCNPLFAHSGDGSSSYRHDA
jgi:hypothetical protein